MCWGPQHMNKVQDGVFKIVHHHTYFEKIVQFVKPNRINSHPSCENSRDPNQGEQKCGQIKLRNSQLYQATMPRHRQKYHAPISTLSLLEQGGILIYLLELMMQIEVVYIYQILHNQVH